MCNKSFQSFLEKKSVFLASSNEFKDNITKIGEKLELSGCVVAPWTKRESHEMGLIFNVEVCPKLYGYSTIIADISDFNPNVFFEIGFALGLGRQVLPIRSDNVYQEFNLPYLTHALYIKYDTVDDAVAKTKDDVRFINDIYSTPRIFDNITQFCLPLGRKKTKEVYVLH